MTSAALLLSSSLSLSSALPSPSPSPLPVFFVFGTDRWVSMFTGRCASCSFMVVLYLQVEPSRCLLYQRTGHDRTACLAVSSRASSCRCCTHTTPSFGVALQVVGVVAHHVVLHSTPSWRCRHSTPKLAVLPSTPSWRYAVLRYDDINGCVIFHLAVSSLPRLG